MSDRSWPEVSLTTVVDGRGTAMSNAEVCNGGQPWAITGNAGQPSHATSHTFKKIPLLIQTPYGPGALDHLAEPTDTVSHRSMSMSQQAFAFESTLRLTGKRRRVAQQAGDALAFAAWAERRKMAEAVQPAMFGPREARRRARAAFTAADVTRESRVLPGVTYVEYAPEVR